MKNYKGLLTSTRNAWKSIKTLVFKFNPSIQKVIVTLENYDLITSILNEQVVYWFDHYANNEFEIIFSLSSKISRSVDLLCEYAYGNIYNETVKTDTFEISQSVIEGYNAFYQRLLENIDSCIGELPEAIEKYDTQFKLSDFNLKQINSLKQLLDNNLDYQ